jgi:hypothetical protein
MTTGQFDLCSLALLYAASLLTFSFCAWRRGPNSWDPIIKYIKDQHSAYLRKELTAMRDRHIHDTRIHCALFFINPSGHSLRAIDIVVLKKLSEVVNVVPIIAKSDSLTMEERFAFKQKVRFPANPVSDAFGLRTPTTERALIIICRVDSRRTYSPQHPSVPFRHRGDR